MLPRRALLSSSLSVSNSDATILSLSLSLSLKPFLFSLFSFLYFFWRRRKFDLLRLYRVCLFFFSVVEGAYVATTSYIGFIRHRIFKYFIYCLRKADCVPTVHNQNDIIYLGVWSTEKWHFLLFHFWEVTFLVFNPNLSIGHHFFFL